MHPDPEVPGKDGGDHSGAIELGSPLPEEHAAWGGLSNTERSRAALSVDPDRQESGAPEIPEIAAVVTRNWIRLLKSQGRCP